MAKIETAWQLTFLIPHPDPQFIFIFQMFLNRNEKKLILSRKPKC